VKHAENIAQKAGCRHARVDTFDFEARGFYEKDADTLRQLARLKP
jgi:hypothetical protein